MQNKIVVLDGSNYNGDELINTGHDNVFVQYEVEVRPLYKIYIGLLVTKSISREEATDFLDSWTESAPLNTFEIWWPLNNFSGGFVANNFNFGEVQSIQILPDLINTLGLDSLYKAAVRN